MPLLLAVSLAGFLAQLVDGALGMAFGITSTTVLVALAYSPAVASSAVHLAEIGTSITSGSFHLRFGNVDKKALLKVGIPGAIGAFVGAVVLSSIDLAAARPVTSVILLALGVVILLRFSRESILGVARRARARWLVTLGLVGGFIDSTGGGGWGPIVTTSLTASNALEPRRAIGTANTAEVLVSLSASAGFLLGLGGDNIPWLVVGALLVGGLAAAPIAAHLVRRAPQRILGLLTGTIIVALNIRQLAVSVGASTYLVVAGTVAAVLVCAWPVVVGIRVHSREVREAASTHQADPAA
jgi:uncharacterized membrane protein YfcA